MLSDLRESGAIEQDADIVTFLYRPEYYGITEDPEGNDIKGQAQLIIAKHRNGSLGEIKLGFYGERSKFVSIQDFEANKSSSIIQSVNFYETDKDGGFQ
jgi:replicative DNA helicase